jgi:molecular chaperone DnaK
MRKEAEAHADSDRRQRDLIEIRNRADNAIYTAVRLQQGFGEKVPEQNRVEIEQAISELRTGVQEDDVNAIGNLIEYLELTLERAGSFIYGTKSAPKPISLDPNAKTAPLDGLTNDD